MSFLCLFYQIMKNLTSYDFANYIRSKINLTHTQNVSYYHPEFASNTDHGTSHLSIISPDGGAVSATTTINSVLAVYFLLIFVICIIFSSVKIIFSNCPSNSFSSLIRFLRLLSLTMVDLLAFPLGLGFCSCGRIVHCN